MRFSPLVLLMLMHLTGWSQGVTETMLTVPANSAVINADGHDLSIDPTSSIAVGQNMPNPAKEQTIVPVFLSKSQPVTITISNLIGKKITTHSLYLQQGRSNVPLDLHGLQPGIYMYSLTNGAQTITRRMIISSN